MTLSLIPRNNCLHGLPCWLSVKNHLLMQEMMQVQSLGGEDLLDKEMATYSSILAAKSHGQRSSGSPWGRRRVRHDLVTK